MGSISSPVSTSSTTYFNGMSSYAQDLNNSIAREVSIASLPIQLLQTNETTLANQSSEMQKLSSDMSAVQSAINSLDTAVSSSLLAATITQPSVAQVTVGSGAIAGSYSLEVDNLGSPSSAISTSGVTDPTSQTIGSGGPYTLTVNGQTISSDITPAADNLNSLAQAINDAGGGVQATVVNLGSDTSPNYVLSLQSTTLGDVTMQVTDGSDNALLGSTTAGEAAQYQVNGQAVNSGSDTVTLATGLTVTLQGTNVGSPTTITVAPNTSGISSALSSFVSAYNSAIAELNNNRGQNGGALAGQSVVYELTDALQGLANYSGGDGTISSMSQLGIEFDDTTGTLSFDSSAFSSATSGQIDALTQFLGSSTGGGFLATASNTLTGILDPESGYLVQDILNMNTQIQGIDSQITDQQNQVNVLQQNLTQQMASADAMIYSMQQQADYYNGLFQSMQMADNMLSSYSSGSTS